MALSINFRDLLPEAAISNRDVKEVVKTVVDSWQNNYELIDDEIDGLLVITDVDETPEEYLDYIASLLGLELLGLDTAEQKRALIKNAVAIYKIKGTETSWEIIFKTLGFETDIIELWWDDSSKLVTTDPLFGHLAAGYDPINPDVDILGIHRVAEFNNPALNPFGDLTPDEIDRLENPVTGDTYQVSNTGIINPGAVNATIDDIIQWDGTKWIKIKHYKTLDQLEADITRPQPFDGAAAYTEILDTTSPGPIPSIRVVAGDVGPWGNDIEVEVTDGTNPATQFNLIVRYDGTEIVTFTDLEKDLAVPVDNIEDSVNSETFYIDIQSIDTFGVEKRPANGVYPLGQSGANVSDNQLGQLPRNTKSPYVDIILSVDFDDIVDSVVLNKAAFFDGRIKEVKPAHIRIRVKRIEASITEDANLEYNDDDLTAQINAEIVDVLQPTCDPPPGGIVVYFHNGFIRSRTGLFSRGYSVEFPDGIPDVPEAAGGDAGYVYAYDGASGLTYGDTDDTLTNDFTYGFIFDPEVCAQDTITMTVDGDAAPFVDEDFYGVTVPATITYNGAFSFNGFMPFNSSPIDPANVDGDPADNSDPQGGVTIVRCDPVTGDCELVLDWKYSDT